MIKWRSPLLSVAGPFLCGHEPRLQDKLKVDREDYRLCHDWSSSTFISWSIFYYQLVWSKYSNFVSLSNLEIIITVNFIISDFQEGRSSYAILFSFWLCEQGVRPCWNIARLRHLWKDLSWIKRKVSGFFHWKTSIIT